MRFNKSIPVGKELLLWGEMVEDKKRMRICSGKILIENEFFATGIGKLMPMENGSFLKE